MDSDFIEILSQGVTFEIRASDVYSYIGAGGSVMLRIGNTYLKLSAEQALKLGAALTKHAEAING